MLVEREAELATLARERERAAGGTGRVVFLAGEAGVGKTSLVREVVGGTAGWRRRHGAGDRMESPTALAPLVDAFPEFAEVVQETAEGERLRLFRRLREALAQEPTVLVLEDLHWADEATLGFLRFVVRRLDDLPLLVLATYRDDQAATGGPLSVLLGDLASAPAVTRIVVRPLSAFGVAELVRRHRSAVHASDLHRRSGGNPFFVTEVLATSTDTVPPTVRDAVLARTATVSVAARHVLDAASVVGPGGEAALVLATSGQAAAALDECVVHGVLVEDRNTGGVSFRHELAREAVESSLLPSLRLDLNRAVLGWLLATADPDHRRVAQHAAVAGDAELVLAHAPPAAARAARLGSHRESAELLRIAIRHATSLSPTDQAELLDQLSYQCYLTDQVAEALAHRRMALALYEELGLPERVGDAQRWISRLSWFLARGEDARRFASLAVHTLEPLGPTRELAMAYSNRSQVAMLASETADAVSWGNRAIDLARALGDAEIEAHALNNVGNTRCGSGEIAAGVSQLEHSLDLSLAHGFEEHAARAYANLCSSAIEAREFTVAERHVRAGMDYSTEHDLDSFRRYMTADLAVLMTEVGRYDEAEVIAESLIDDTGVAPLARIKALVVASRLRARRGDASGAASLLEVAHELADGSAVVQRQMPVSVAAELAWLAGDGEQQAAASLADTLVLVDDKLTEWDRGEALWWLHVLGRGTEGDDAAARSQLPVAAPYTAMLAGDWSGAAALWRTIGSPMWAALAQTRSPALVDARAGLDALLKLGAAATHAAAVRDRQRLHLPLPREPRASTRSNAAGLTAREMEVLRLVGDGLTNAEIAAALVLSERTVEHHVSAVLRKLEAPTRARAVATAARSGLLGGGMR